MIAAALLLASLAVGDEAPVFSGPLYNAKAAGASSFDLASLVGEGVDDSPAQAVVVSFFASWCKPCQRELPLLQELSKAYGPRGLRLVSVAIDRDAEGMKQAEALIEQSGISYPVVKDRFNLIARRWLGSKTTLPSLFIVGRDGLIKLVKHGYESDAAEFLRGEVERALRPVRYLTKALASGPAPLLVVLHGLGGTAAEMEQWLRLDRLSSVLIALPDGMIDSHHHQFWNVSPLCCDFEDKGPDDLGYLSSIIDDAIKNHGADQRRVFVLGFSSGGHLAHRAACELSDKIAGVVSLAGAAGGFACQGKTPVAVLEVHGDADEIMPLDGGQVGGAIPKRGVFPPLDQTLRAWAARDGCAKEPKYGPQLDLDAKVAGTETLAAEWPGCKGGGVALWKMRGVGHVPSFAPDFAERAMRWLLAHQAKG